MEVCVKWDCWLCQRSRRYDEIKSNSAVPRGWLTSKPTWSNTSGCSATSAFFVARGHRTCIQPRLRRQVSGFCPVDNVFLPTSIALDPTDYAWIRPQDAVKKGPGQLQINDSPRGPVRVRTAGRVWFPCITEDLIMRRRMLAVGLTVAALLAGVAPLGGANKRPPRSSPRRTSASRPCRPIWRASRPIRSRWRSSSTTCRTTVRNFSSATSATCR